MLQARVDPNVIPPQQVPTTMLSLAVALRNRSLVGLLLEATAEIYCKEARVPPLITAVLHQDQGIVKLLLDARANPWQEVSLGAILDRQWCRWDFSHREQISAVHIAAAQTRESNCLRLLLDSDPGNDLPVHRTQPVLTALSERTTNSLDRVIEDYQRRTGLQKPQLGHESLYWRKVMAGLYFPQRSLSACKPTADRHTLRGWLYQYD